ncbi:Acyl-lipid (7-3)-desaturase [Diplonema papillatum]|nr:Acyl-lipid (7-3)-desaturase [Diplonema papillatum]
MGKGGKQEVKKPSSAMPAAEPSKLFTVWKINGKLYDLSTFAATHPGGERALENAASHPHGEFFIESYHPDPELVYSILPKYEIKSSNPAVENPVNDTFETKINYTFKEDGFYRKVKKAGMLAIRGKTKAGKKKTSKVNLRGDDVYVMVDIIHLLVLFLTSFLLIMGSWKAALVTGLLRGACIMRVAHSASHASLSPYPELNGIMYYVAMMFSGTTPEIWNRKHVVRHHVNTNEDGLDEDRMDDVKSVFKSAPWHEFHKNQHIYCWPFYMHIVFPWTVSDVLSNSHRKDAGPLPFSTKQSLLNVLTQVAHISLTYVLPVYFNGFYGLFLVWLNTVLTSVTFGFEFIVNHEIDGCDIYEEALGKDTDWGLYQAISSADFHAKGLGSWFFNQWTGGLNLQICHHLFPGVHYRHYPTLTKIIYEHMEKVGQKPTSSTTVADAVYNHHQFLKNCSEKYGKLHLKAE